MFDDLLKSDSVEIPSDTATETTEEMTPQQRFNAAQDTYHEAVKDWAEFLHNDPNLNMDDMDTRYSTAVDLRKLRTMSVCVLGAGGIGSWIVRALAGMGVQNISLVDYDSVELHNVGPQMYPLSDLGRKKVEATADSIREFRGIEIQQVGIKVESYAHLCEALGYVPDVLITAVDNMAIRKTLFTNMRSADSENLPKLYIDTRMGFGFWNVYALPLRAIPAMGSTGIQCLRKYEQEALFDDDEGVYEACTERAIVYTGANIASYVCALLHKWNDHLESDSDLLFSFIRGNQIDGFGVAKSFNSRLWTSPEMDPAVTGVIEQYTKMLNSQKIKLHKLQEFELEYVAIREMIRTPGIIRECFGSLPGMTPLENITNQPIYRDFRGILKNPISFVGDYGEVWNAEAGHIVKIVEMNASHNTPEREVSNCVGAECRFESASGANTTTIYLPISLEDLYMVYPVKGFNRARDRSLGRVSVSTQGCPIRYNDLLQKFVIHPGNLSLEERRVQVKDITRAVRQAHTVWSNSEDTQQIEDALRSANGWVWVFTTSSSIEDIDITPSEDAHYVTVGVFNPFENEIPFGSRKEDWAGVISIPVQYIAIDKNYKSVTQYAIMEEIRETREHAESHQQAVPATVYGIPLVADTGVFSNSSWNGWARVLSVASSDGIYTIRVRNERSRVFEFTESLETFLERVNYALDSHAADSVLPPIRHNSQRTNPPSPTLEEVLVNPEEEDAGPFADTEDDF